MSRNTKVEFHSFYEKKSSQHMLIWNYRKMIYFSEKSIKINQNKHMLIYIYININN